MLLLVELCGRFPRGSDSSGSNLCPTYSCTTDVVSFYSHSCKKMGPLAVLSNFYDQSSCPFDFRVPLAFCACAIPEAERSVECTCSEKAIMLAKAAIMGDLAIYREIAVTKEPGAAKALGRTVGNFDQESWDRSLTITKENKRVLKIPKVTKVCYGCVRIIRCVCSIAFHVVYLYV